jgi:hypothetical protein
MNVNNNMNSMTIYNNIQYEQLQTHRPFDSYTPNLTKSMHSTKPNTTVNDHILFLY